jgi:hypothetical protein
MVLLPVIEESEDVMNALLGQDAVGEAQGNWDLLTARP